MPKKLSLDDFIHKSSCIHNNLYDYSKVIYKNNKTKVCIIDPEYGEYYQTPNSHMNGAGHPKRGLLKCSNISNTETFIFKARLIHNNFYDYSKVEYIHSSIKICIIDPDYGEFWQLPSGHLSGYGNPLRGKEKSKQWQYENTKLSLNEFINRCNTKHDNFYDYSKVEYINSYTDVCIIDPEYGEFYMSPDQHMKGSPHPLRSKRGEYEIDHIIPLSIICSSYERKFCKFQKSRPLYKFLNSEINLKKVNSKENIEKSDKINFNGTIINCRNFRNDYDMIYKIIRHTLKIDPSDIIDMDKKYVS